MPLRADQMNNSVTTRRFWIVVGLICLVGGALGYQAGRYWVSDLLGDVKVEAKSVKLPGELDKAPAANVADNAQQGAPSKAKIVVEQRAPSVAEKSELTLKAAERKAALNEPQDGAQLNARQYADTAGGSGNYVVAAGSFLQRSNAEHAVAELSRNGYRPYITQYHKDGKTYQRVNVQAFSSRADADQLVKQLQDAGIPARVLTQ